MANAFATGAVSMADLASTKSHNLWVLNNSDALNPTGVRDDVFISIRVGTEELPVIVRSTWLPINLTESAPREELLKSARLMKAMREGLVRPISDGEAEALMSRAEAQNEMSRLDALDRAIREASSAKKLTVEVTNRRPVETRNLSLDTGGESEEQGLSSSFVAFVDRLNHEATNSNEVLTRLRVRGSSLKDNEVDYLIKKLDSTKFDKLIARLKETRED